MRILQRANFRRCSRIICDYRLRAETAAEFIEGLAREGQSHMINRVVLATGATADQGVGQLVEKFALKLLPKPYGREDLVQALAFASSI